MRQITIDVCNAFESRETLSKSNSHTDGNAMYLHGNKIAEYRDGSLYITNAGWPTVTTKERLNGLHGVSINQKAGVWYLNGYKWNGEWVQVDGFAGNVSKQDQKKDRDMLKRIKAYSDLYANKAIYPLIPGGGDCWYCAFTDKEGVIMGDLSNSDHLESHMDEKYVHGSIAFRALKEAGYHDSGIGICLHGFAPDNVKRAMYRYMKKRLTNLAR